MYVEWKRTLIPAFQGHQPITEADSKRDHVLEDVFFSRLQTLRYIFWRWTWDKMLFPWHKMNNGFWDQHWTYWSSERQTKAFYFFHGKRWKASVVRFSGGLSEKEMLGTCQLLCVCVVAAYTRTNKIEWKKFRTNQVSNLGYNRDRDVLAINLNFKWDVFEQSVTHLYVCVCVCERVFVRVQKSKR